MRSVALSVAGNGFPHFPTQLAWRDALTEVDCSVLAADPPNLRRKGRGGNGHERKEGEGRKGKRGEKERKIKGGEGRREKDI